MFPEGGNYSDEEAVNTVNSLSVLSYNIFQTQTEISDKYNQSNFKSIIKIKESLSTILKPYPYFILGHYNNNYNVICNI